MYTCPMHPEVKSKKPGRCPKCGMDLVRKEELKNSTHTQDMKNTSGSYIPLLVVLDIILLTSIVLTVKTGFSMRHLIEYFMIGFFITFSTFKLIDLKGFAQGYSTYDLLARKVFGYGYIYPFIELLFGLGMILGLFATQLLILEVIIMTFSGLGVAIKLSRHERFQCVCLGTFLKVPLTKVTLIEDFGMAALALFLLIFK